MNNVDIRVISSTFGLSALGIAIVVSGMCPTEYVVAIIGGILALGGVGVGHVMGRESQPIIITKK